MIRSGFLILFFNLLLWFPVIDASGFRRPWQDADTATISLLIKKAGKNLKDPVSLPSAKKMLDSAAAACKEYNVDPPAIFNLIKAEYFILSKDYGNASQEATLALQKAKAENDKMKEARIYTFFGKYYFNTGFFSESLINYEKSNEIAEKNKLKGIISSNYLGIAGVYKSLNKLPLYRDKLLSAISNAIRENDTASILYGYFNLGSLYAEADRHYNLADSVLRRCISVATIRKDSSYNARAWANLGWNFYLEKQFDSAIVCYNKSLKYCLPAKRFGTAANSYGNLGTINRDLGHFPKALDYYQKGIEQANLANDNYILSWIYRDMSDLYLLKKDTSNAYLNFVLFKKFNDVYLQTATMKGLDDATARFQADSHRKEVELLSLKLKNQRLIILGTSGFFVLMMLILLLIYSRARIDAKRKITEMDHRISELTQANLRQQMNPHFIFNTLNSIQYYMYQHDKLATNNYLTKFSSLIRKVLENSRHTSIPIRDELDALRLYLDLEMLRFKEKFDYHINVDEEIDTIIYKIPTMLIQPYVENSLTHGLIPSDRKGFIKIALNLENDYISCTIEDNGIGRKAAEMKKGFDGKEHSSLGTKITTSRLDLVNALCGTCLKTIYTDLQDGNGSAAGTRVEIHIPIMS